MKRFLLIILVVVTLISSCEKDDFCTETPVTPSLILRFYDNSNRTSTKSTSGLYVWADNKDSIFVNVATDSLVIPLNPAASQTIYNLSQGNIINQLTIDYNVDYEYVSRSCGFKAVYDEISFSSNNTWINELQATTTIVNNENAAHVQVYH